VLAVDLGDAGLVFLSPGHRDSPFPRTRCGRRDQPATAIPIERAVPSTWRLADSMSAVLRSGSLMVAISSTWALVTVPTCSRPDVEAPFSNPAAWRSRAGVGGVLRMNEKVRSS